MKKKTLKQLFDELVPPAGIVARCGFYAEAEFLMKQAYRLGLKNARKNTK